MSRAEVMDAMWAKMEAGVYITRGEFDAAMAGWEVQTEVRDGAGALALASIARGCEYHFESFGRGVQATRGMVRREVQRIIDAHGMVRTRTPKCEARQRRFNELVGFTQVGEDEFYVHYEMRRFGPCRQSQ